MNESWVEKDDSEDRKGLGNIPALSGRRNRHPETQKKPGGSILVDRVRRERRFEKIGGEGGRRIETGRPPTIPGDPQGDKYANHFFKTLEGGQHDGEDEEYLKDRLRGRRTNHFTKG